MSILVPQIPHIALAERLLDQLKQCRGASRYWVAYSGGLDSHVLLHVLSQFQYQLIPSRVHAAYINHGLNPQADAWARHCGEICAQLKVPFQTIDVDATPLPGESPEAKARQARYSALKRLVREGDCLLTAHHKDDQLETLLLQLMRGSGPKGLAAMPVVANFGGGEHLRPLLTCTREEIHAYAYHHQLKWIEDDSNQNAQFDRNFLRHDIIPRLKLRWPSLLQTANRTAALCAEASELLEHEAARDIRRLTTQGSDALDVAGLCQLSAPQMRNVLRHWIHARGFLLPSKAQLNSVVINVIKATNDAVPLVAWKGCEVRRYRNMLHIMPPLHEHNKAQVIAWNASDVLVIDGVGTITVQQMPGQGIASKYVAKNKLTIRFRQGGEKIKPVGADHHRSLKKLLQEHGVPPWLRERIPLLYVNDQLAAVGQMAVDDRFKTNAAEQGILINWQPAECCAPLS